MSVLLLRALHAAFHGPCKYLCQGLNAACSGQGSGMPGSARRERESCYVHHLQHAAFLLAQGDSRIVALMSLEIGGENCIEPMVLAAELGLPVVDCDGMGRAFPELQMFVPFINGFKAYPCVLVAADGRVQACTQCPSAKALEDFMRVACFDFGYVLFVLCRFYTKCVCVCVLFWDR